MTTVSRKRIVKLARTFFIATTLLFIYTTYLTGIAAAADTPAPVITLPPGSGQVGNPSVSGCGSFVETGKYCLLAPLGSYFKGGIVDIRGNGLSGYLNQLYKIGVGVATALALIFITIGGLQYASTDSVTGTEHGKETIRNALVGLFVVLGSYVMLNAINPDLLNTSLKLDAVPRPTAVGADVSNIQTVGAGALGSRTAEEQALAKQTWRDVTPNTDYIPELDESGNLRVRSTIYNPTEAGADEDTKNFRSATGVPLQYADGNTVGVVAVDPKVVPYGSLVTVQTSDGPRYYIAADTGSAVVSRQASNGTVPVFDFFSNSAVGADYATVNVQRYTGSTPFTKLDAATQAQFFNIGLYQ